MRETFDMATIALVDDDPVFREAQRNGIAVALIGGEIGRDWPRQDDRHDSSPMVLVSGPRSP